MSWLNSRSHTASTTPCRLDLVRGNTHPNLVGPTRVALQSLALPLCSVQAKMSLLREGTPDTFTGSRDTSPSQQNSGRSRVHGDVQGGVSGQVERHSWPWRALKVMAGGHRLGG
ncbi:hypothetical protein E2C01_014666 [Portunus trituberculatus]|uniref:Uncharacterized protein n=1 Tax=Portunus trituberculatus TaxID=210409 RepID=A0A5B7DKY2_PORTR|nr:hypothetical protein [Portunus trituberculatus]